MSDLGGTVREVIVREGKKNMVVPVDISQNPLRLYRPEFEWIFFVVHGRRQNGCEFGYSLYLIGLTESMFRARMVRDLPGVPV